MNNKFNQSQSSRNSQYGSIANQAPRKSSLSAPMTTKGHQKSSAHTNVRHYYHSAPGSFVPVSQTYFCHPSLCHICGTWLVGPIINPLCSTGWPPTLLVSALHLWVGELVALGQPLCNISIFHFPISISDNLLSAKWHVTFTYIFRHVTFYEKFWHVTFHIWLVPKKWMVSG